MSKLEPPTAAGGIREFSHNLCRGWDSRKGSFGRPTLRLSRAAAPLFANSIALDPDQGWDALIFNSPSWKST